MYALFTDQQNVQNHLKMGLCDLKVRQFGGLRMTYICMYVYMHVFVNIHKVNSKLTQPYKVHTVYIIALRLYRYNPCAVPTARSLSLYMAREYIWPGTCRTDLI